METNVVRSENNNDNIKNVYLQIINNESHENKIKLLKDKRVRNLFLLPDNKDYFISLVKILDLDLPYFIDEDMINYLVDNGEETYRIKAIIDSNSPLKEQVLKDYRIIEKIIDSVLLMSNIYELGIEFGTVFFDYIIKNDNIKAFIFLSSNVQLELLKNPHNFELFKKAKFESSLIGDLNLEVIKFLLNDTYYENVISNLNFNVLDEIVKKGIVLPINETIINSYLNIENINMYRGCIENLKKNNLNLANLISEKRKKTYDLYYTKLNNNGLLEEYNSIYMELLENGLEYINNKYKFSTDISNMDNKRIFKYFLSLSDTKLLEALVDRYFEDITYNFLKNVGQLLTLVLSTKDNIISKENILLYEKIYNFFKLSTEEKINLYKSMNNGKNYIEQFYDDYKKCEEYVYNLYNKEILNPITDINKSPLSSKYGIDVYELSGQPFYALIHQINHYRMGNETNVWQKNMDINTISFSLISHNHIQTVADYYTYIILGFTHIDTNRVIHLYHSDSFSAGRKGSNRIKELSIPSKLDKETVGYSEMLYLQNSEEMKSDYSKYTDLEPSYIMCYDKISEIEVQIAKKYNIPAVLLHTDKYFDINKCPDLYENNYVNYQSVINVPLPKKR